MMKELMVAALTLLAVSSVLASPLIESQLRFQSDLADLLADIFKNEGLKRNKPGFSPARLAQMHALGGMGKRTIQDEDIEKSLQFLRRLTNKFDETNSETRQERRPENGQSERYKAGDNPFHSMAW